MKLSIRSRAARLISAVAAFFVIMSGIAYAGVDPLGQGPSAKADTAETGVEDTGVTDTTMPGDDKDRGIPEEVAAALESLNAYRTAAHAWKECVRGAVKDAGKDSVDVDLSACGATPAAADFGLTETAIAELPEKAAVRIGRVVASIEARLACIVAHAGDAEALRGCFQQVAEEFGFKRGDMIRERRGERGDDAKLEERREQEERRAERGEQRERQHTDRQEERSRDEQPSNREVRGDQTRIHPGQDRNEASARRNG